MLSTDLNFINIRLSSALSGEHLSCDLLNLKDRCTVTNSHLIFIRTLSQNLQLLFVLQHSLIMQALNQAARDPILALVPPTYETLHKLLNLPETEVPHLSNGENNSTYFMGL